MIDSEHFTDAQHDFTKGHSCATQLLWELEDWTAMLVKARQLMSSFLNPQGVQFGPSQRRIRDPLLKWIKALLLDIVQRVVVNESKSDSAIV